MWVKLKCLHYLYEFHGYRPTFNKARCKVIDLLPSVIDRSLMDLAMKQKAFIRSSLCHLPLLVTGLHTLHLLSAVSGDGDGPTLHQLVVSLSGKPSLLRQ